MVRPKADRRETLVTTLPENNSSHVKNGWLEDDRFLLGRLGLFSGAKMVSFRDCNSRRRPWPECLFRSTKALASDPTVPQKDPTMSVSSTPHPTCLAHHHVHQWVPPHRSYPHTLQTIVLRSLQKSQPKQQTHPPSFCWSCRIIWKKNTLIIQHQLFWSKKILKPHLMVSWFQNLVLFWVG